MAERKRSAESAEEDRTIATLEALAAIPGALQIITDEHACQGRSGAKHPRFASFDADTCARYEHPLTDYRHFVRHDVVRLEPVEGTNRYRAHSAEGDWCEGEPAALLARLTESTRG